MLSNLKAIPGIFYKHPIAVCLIIFFIAGVFRWFITFAFDRVIVLCIFMVVVFLSYRIGEKLRHSEAAANRRCQDPDKWQAKAEKTPSQVKSMGDQTLTNWWG